MLARNKEFIARSIACCVEYCDRIVVQVVSGQDNKSLIRGR